MITHEKTDLRVGPSDAQSLSMNIVRESYTLCCAPAGSDQNPACHRDNAQDVSRREGLLCGLCQEHRQTVRGETDVWPAWNKELTLAHRSPPDSVFLGVRFVLIFGVIVTCQSCGGHGICTRHAVFFQHAFHITSGWRLPDGIIATQLPRTHIRLRGTCKERESDLHGEILLHLACNFIQQRARTNHDQIIDVYCNEHVTRKVHEERWLCVKNRVVM